MRAKYAHISLSTGMKFSKKKNHTGFFLKTFSVGPSSFLHFNESHYLPLFNQILAFCSLDFQCCPIALSCFHPGFVGVFTVLIILFVGPCLWIFSHLCWQNVHLHRIPLAGKSRVLWMWQWPPITSSKDFQHNMHLFLLLLPFLHSLFFLIFLTSVLPSSSLPPPSCGASDQT